MPTILLIEDNEANRKMLAYRLQRKGYEVIIAVDGSEGVFLAVDRQPDLILMDLNLPVKDGWEATKEIKANSETQHIPIIALTANTLKSDRDRALECGCDDYDTKPVELPRLLGKIKAQLKLISVPVPESTGLKIVPLKGQVESKSVTAASTQQPHRVAKSVTKKILLVEDNEINRNMLSYRLKRQNYKLVIAIDGAEAISQATKEKPDLILMDLGLPGINGWDATRKIKANSDTKHIPIIALTAHVTDSDRALAFEAGCVDYATKIIDFPRLVDKIEAQFKQIALPQTKLITTEVSSSKVQTQTAEPVTTKILLVEDNETNRNMLSYRLKRRKYELVIAVDGAEAVSQATKEKPDLILMDLSLPVMNGWDATKKIKANPDTKHIPIIALTAHAMSGDRKQALDAGCDDYDTKPIDFPRLQAKMKALLERDITAQLEAASSKINSIKAKVQTELIAVEQLQQELAEPPISNLPSQETQLLQLPEAIRILYAPVETRAWRTGNLVKISNKIAKIYSKKIIKLSPNNKIEIRLSARGITNPSEKIHAEVVAVSEQNDKYFTIEFSSHYAQIDEFFKTTLS